ncbi:hypothetical protein ACHHYP_20091 [Achlya hypogyna]|uniref:Uncharacterized protein n=1 Tax=Achlya hypogyna TaxID=1202772 RepID=A0A1V9ZS58_ACHHY|nr:hypothetical protein ACHHYP_20091 [Achlya hypogyna]
MGASLASAVNLRSLYVSDIPSSGAVLATALATVLPTMQHLHSVTLIDIGWGAITVAPVVTALAALPSLKDVNIQWSNSEGDADVGLASLPQCCPALASLRATYSPMSTAGLMDVLRAASTCPQLHSLDVSFTHVDALEDLVLLVAACTPTLTRMQLRLQGVSSAQMLVFLRALAHTDQMRCVTVELLYTGIDNSGVDECKRLIDELGWCGNNADPNRCTTCL